MKSIPVSAILAIFCSVFVQSSWSLDDKDGTSVTCNDFNSQGNPYFGDTHVHTTFSVDAFIQGVNTTPEQAYQFAKGAPIGLHPFNEDGSPTRIVQGRPLDFAVVTDHAEFFGEYAICTDPSDPLYNEPKCVNLRLRNGDLVGWNIALGALQTAVKRFNFCSPDGVADGDPDDGSICTAEVASIWQGMQTAAEQYYDRSPDCTFTTFIGYEWTGAPTTEYGNVDESGIEQVETLNLHRNIIFANKIVPDAPTSYLDAPYPEYLWNALEAQCLNVVNGTNKCDVLTIPHNSNLSQGLIFEAVQPNGNPYGKAQAQRRARMEPLIEIVQHKGQSECLPNGGDELCDFEVVPWGHLAGNFIPATVPKVEGTVRNVLKQGLLMKDNLNANAFKYGFIGSTDTHLGTPGLVEESAGYPGHGGAAGGSGGTSVNTGITDAPQFNPGGLAVVWATQNSRAALFDAMRRREVYATSGPRHVVRFFGGWDLPSNICGVGQDTVGIAIANNAVPMGSTLPLAADTQIAPQFVVSASKDPGTTSIPPGNDLQRIQIVKGWTDINGVHEQVFEVAGNPSNGATVNTNTCETIGTGDADLCQLWQDPTFNADQNAFYYARVVENPSCRWSQRQCIAANPPVDCTPPVADDYEYAACCDADIPKTVQERSWTSPIWYNKQILPPAPGC